MSDITPCPLCGSTAEVDATGSSEMYGMTWQTLWIKCKDDHKLHCQMQVSIDADFLSISREANRLLEQLWADLKSVPPAPVDPPSDVTGRKT